MGFPLHPIRMLTLDATGTMIKFKGRIGDIYCKAAATWGLTSPDHERIHKAFSAAYKQTREELPAFGGPEYCTKNWWRICVKRSFDLAGFHFKPDVQEHIFKNIYAEFGSHDAYDVFDDVAPFLEWAKQKQLIVGVVSDACDRYEDSIMPMLGLHSKVDFVCLSKNENVQKPDPRLFQAALRFANATHGNKNSLKFLDIKPSEVVHIGDKYEMDYIGAREAGMHPLMMDRFNTEAADEMRRNGIEVMRDLTEVREWLEHRNFCLRPSRWWEAADDPKKMAATGQ